eukprot:TRINITY_DN958_c0_g1_i1.p1 TRINITY_DN958_c0_g1~~TRINITY_DN958_c0_g1_i1.p1  ORF type:complete len:337 (-),score=55.05 TRINITY_DN958_c0_g1_i1:139-1149(-)
MSDETKTYRILKRSNSMKDPYQSSSSSMTTVVPQGSPRIVVMNSQTPPVKSHSISVVSSPKSSSKKRKKKGETSQSAVVGSSASSGSKSTGHKLLQSNLISDRKCRENLFRDLLNVREEGGLCLALNVHESEFEVLEFYGDSVLYETISKFIMETRRFMDPHLMTQLRTSCIKNESLAKVYDILSMESLLPAKYQGVTKKVKTKGDIVEAVIGELSENGYTELVKKFIAFIAYVGEESYFKIALEHGSYMKRLPMRVEDIIIPEVETEDTPESLLFYSPKGLDVRSLSETTGKPGQKWDFADTPTPVSTVEDRGNGDIRKRSSRPSRRVSEFSVLN